MKRCENCELPIHVKYGSGRFCSSVCARGYSTKAKREQINEKVSKTLTKPKLKKVCEGCNVIFEIGHNKRHQRYCSPLCSKNNISDDTRKKLSMIAAKRASQGKLKLQSIKCEYEFNGVNIKCDSLLERRGLKLLVCQYDIVSIIRSNIYISYQHDGKNKTYNPDFILTLADNTKIVLECKTYMSKNKTQWSHRLSYFGTIDAKKKCLIEYCHTHNHVAMWYDGRKNIVL